MVTVTLSLDLVELIDATREQHPRSRFIERLCWLAMTGEDPGVVDGRRK